MMTLKKAVTLLSLFSAGVVQGTNNDQQFLYRVDAKLFYSDKLINPTSQIDWHHFDLQNKQESRRALGLTESKLFLGWIHNDKTKLHLTLRPDSEVYTDGNGNQVEFDSRTGKTFRTASSLRLLDAYAVSVNAGDSFNFEVGVFESMAPLLMAYDNILEFGLNTRLVRKYSGVRILWKIDHDSFAKSQTEAALGSRFFIHVFQNSDDRNERYLGNDSNFDIAPTSQDPHKGVGFGFNWRPSTDFNLTSLLGFRRNEDDAGQRSSDLLARLGWEFALSAGTVPLNLAHDLRYNRVRYDLPGINAKTLNQMSSSLTLAAWLKDNVAIFGGFHVGQSEHHQATDPRKADVYNGWQVDTGIKRIVNEVLVGHLIFAYENRTLDNGSEEVGGFPATPTPKKKVARFALQLHYQLGGP